MKRIKKQNGITLLALIVTVVVLVILASVAISNLSEDGIISQAGDAKDQTGEFISSTTQQHQDYVDYLKNDLAGLGSANCSHDSVYENYTHDFSSYDHITETKCAKCNMVLSTNTVNNYRIDYSNQGEYGHQLDIRCLVCNSSINEPWEDHDIKTDGEGNIFCTKCDYYVGHTHSWDETGESRYIYTGNGDRQWCTDYEFKYNCENGCGLIRWMRGEHDVKKEVVEQATCVKQATYRYYCTKCEWTHRVIEGEFGGHKIITVGRPATCTEWGGDWYICTLCDEEWQDSFSAPPLGHDYGSNGFCTRCGNGMS